MGKAQIGANSKTISSDAGIMQNMYQETKVLLPFDPTPVQLELRPPIELDPEIPAEEQLPELALYLDSKAALDEWEREREEARNAGIKDTTIPEYAQYAQDLKMEEEGQPQGLENSSLPGAQVATEAKRVTCC